MATRLTGDEIRRNALHDVEQHRQKVPSETGNLVGCVSGDLAVVGVKTLATAVSWKALPSRAIRVPPLPPGSLFCARQK